MRLARSLRKVPMHSLALVLAILLPPAIALLLSRLLRSRAVGNYPQQGFRLGKHAFWIILTVIYAAVFASALIEHKI